MFIMFVLRRHDLITFGDEAIPVKLDIIYICIYTYKILSISETATIILHELLT